MTLQTNPAVDKQFNSIPDAFGTLLAGFRQVAEGLYGLGSALLQGASGLGAHLVQDPVVLVLGIILGIAASLAAWSVVSIARHAGNASSAKAPPRGKMPAPKTQNHLQTLAMPEVEKQLNSSPEGLTQA